MEQDGLSQSNRQPSSLIRNVGTKVAFQNEDRQSEGMTKAAQASFLRRPVCRGWSGAAATSNARQREVVNHSPTIVAPSPRYEALAARLKRYLSAN